MHRRQVLVIFGAGSLAIAAYRILAGTGMSARGLTWPRGLTPVVTPTADHYRVSKNYTDTIPLARALHPGTLLAYEMNGQPVPRQHGAPLRAIVPGIYGVKNVKWIEAIELVSGDTLGYWQQRGWSDAAPYQSRACS